MHLKKSLGLLAAASVVTLAACGGGSGSGGTELTVNTFLTEDHPATLAFEAWMEEVTERTDGEITFETFYNGSLCGAADSVSCVEDRTADVALAVPAYNPDMTLANIGSVAFQTSDLTANAKALNKLYADNEDYRGEYEDRGLSMLYTFNNSMAVLTTVDEIDGLEDLDGMSVRASGATSTGIAELGANPVAIDPAEIYESLERGVVEGVTLPLESIIDYRLTEVAPHVYDLGEFMGSYAMNTYLMNLDVLEGLTDEQREIIAEVSQEISDSFIDEYLIPAVQGNCEDLGENGVKRLGPEDVGTKWAEQAGKAQRAAWEKSASKSTDATAMFDAYLANIEEFSTGSSHSTADICGV